MRVITNSVTAAVLATVATIGAAHADVVISPVSATATSTFPDPCCVIENTINHSGLLTDFTSGVTDFDSYFAGNPMATFNFIDPNTGNGTKWFSNEGDTSATIVYNLGSVLPINRFAFWNDDSVGVTNFDLLVSTNGINYTPVLTDISPMQTPEGNNIPAQIFQLGNQTAQYVELNVYNCPKPDVTPDAAPLDDCAISEVAFAETQSTPPGTVPAPSALLLFGTGLMGLVRRRRAAG